MHCLDPLVLYKMLWPEDRGPRASLPLRIIFNSEPKQSSKRAVSRTAPIMQCTNSPLRNVVLLGDDDSTSSHALTRNSRRRKLMLGVVDGAATFDGHLHRLQKFPTHEVDERHGPRTGLQSAPGREYFIETEQERMTGMRQKHGLSVAALI